MKDIRVTKIVVVAEPNSTKGDCIAQSITLCMEKATDIMLIHGGDPILICHAALFNFIIEYNKAVPAQGPAQGHIRS